jgi:hypothetical protein
VSIYRPGSPTKYQTDPLNAVSSLIPNWNRPQGPGRIAAADADDLNTRCVACCWFLCIL